MALLLAPVRNNKRLGGNPTHSSLLLRPLRIAHRLFKTHASIFRPPLRSALEASTTSRQDRLALAWHTLVGVSRTILCVLAMRGCGGLRVAGHRLDSNSRWTLQNNLSSSCFLCVIFLNGKTREKTPTNVSPFLFRNAILHFVVFYACFLFWLSQPLY